MTVAATETQVRTVLYRLFDAAGTLLYVGISSDPKVRWINHAGEKAWFPQVATTTFEWFDTRSSAEAAEVVAIKTEKPLHNIIHNVTRSTAASRPKRLLPNLPPRDPRLVDLVSLHEAADILGVSRQGVHKMLTRGELRGARAGDTWVFRRAAVEKYRNNKEQP